MPLITIAAAGRSGCARPAAWSTLAAGRLRLGRVHLGQRRRCRPATGRRNWRLHPAVPADTRVAAVGPATAAALRARRAAGRPGAGRTAGSGAALGRDLAARRQRRDRAAAAVRPGRTRTAGCFADQGLSRRDGDRLPHRTVARSTGRVADDLRAGRFERGAVHLTQHGRRAGRHLPIAAGTVLGAIGRPTAAAVQTSGRRIDFVADQPTARALVGRVDRAVQRSAIRPDNDRREAAPTSGRVIVNSPSPNYQGSFPTVRPRRLRRTPAIRRLVAQTRLHPADLVLPMFVKESLTEPVPLTSMPGVLQHTRDSLKAAAASRRSRPVSAG